MPIDPSAFSVNERPNEYEVCFDIEAEARITVIAASPEEARLKAEAEVSDEGFEIYADDFTETRFRFVRKTPPMYRVTRDGQSMQVSRLDEGDIPRQPDERGF